MATWQRWLKYGKAKLDDALRSGDEELTRREAQLEAEAAEKPWLRSTSDAPSMDEVRARIEHEAAQAEARKVAPTAGPPADGAPTSSTSPAPSTPGEAFDLAEQQRQADERLAAIRSELGLDEAAPGARPPDDHSQPPGGDGEGPR